MGTCRWPTRAASRTAASTWRRSHATPVSRTARRSCSLIDECLALAGVALEDVGCIAVSSGPGSFTGLRVALATAKGLALGGDVPLVGVATLEALAATALPGWSAQTTPPVGEGTVIVPCLDARKGEVYAAAFRVRAPDWRRANPRLERLAPDAALSPAGFTSAFATWLDAGGTGMLLGDGPQRYPDVVVETLAGRVEVLPFARCHPRGATVARLGAGSFAAGGAHDRAALVPHYARASEAEVMRERRSRSDTR